MSAAEFERTEGGGLRVRVDPRLYNERVVFKALYWYGADYEIGVELGSDERTVITIHPQEGALTDELAVALRARLLRDLVDFKTRDIVAQETQAVRALLIAKAFATGDELDGPPPGAVSDPVGFDPGDFFPSPLAGAGPPR